MRKILPVYILVGILAFPDQMNAQDTYPLVYQLLQANCGTSGCHDGSSSKFDVTLSQSAVYSELVNVTPLNATAAGKDHKLIDPGYPDRSFLLRKVAYGISDPLVLDQPSEGADMPNGLPKLADQEIELIRQWILFGAPETGNVVDTGLINTYYRDGGIDDTYADHTPPPAGTGFQIYLGRLFAPPSTEMEFYIKYDPKFTSAIEVPKVETYMPSNDHHFVLYSFNPFSDVNYPEGLRSAYDTTIAASHQDIKNPIATGPGKWTYELPTGTAYFWPQSAVFDVNIHFQNSNPDSILATDVYINVYTQPVGTTTDYMYIRLFPDLTISIPQDGNEHTFTTIAQDTTETDNWKIWNLYTHTHRYGTDYDVYVRDTMEVDEKGEQLYEGFYSYEDGFNAGYYRWGPEVTFRYYDADSLFEVDPRIGFVHEAKFVNTDGPDPTIWGLTSLDEMMVMAVQFIYAGNTVSINSDEGKLTQLSVYPNPASGQFELNVLLNESALLEIDLYDLLGKKIKTLWNEEHPAGPFSEKFRSSDLDLKPGVYMVRVRVGDASNVVKLIISE